jgi:ABC-type nitrate/sulfonate/bicarbonate transport system substrate-binding protein
MGEHLQLLLAGEVNFATGNGAQVVARNAQGLEIVSVALVGQKSEQGFAVLADSSIRSVKDWEGRTFGYRSSVPAEFLAIAKANGVDPSKVEQVRVAADPRILSEGRVDILQVFFSNEPGVLDRLGIKTRVFDPSDYGIQALGLTYITSRDFLMKDPDAVERFLKAVLRGIDYADKNRDEAVSIIMKYAPNEDPAHQRFMLDTELARALTDDVKRHGIGWQTQAQWQGMHDTLLEYGVIERATDVPRLFSDAALRKIYKNGALQWP